LNWCQYRCREGSQDRDLTDHTDALIYWVKNLVTYLTDATQHFRPQSQSSTRSL